MNNSIEYFSKNNNDYLETCMEILQSSFNENILLNTKMKKNYIKSFFHINMFIEIIFNLPWSIFKLKLMNILNLHDFPFFNEKIKKDIICLEKHNEVKMSYQALFLLILRLKIDEKYKDKNSFLHIYPEFLERDEEQIKKLFNFANYMDLLLYTTKASANKGLALDLVTRICEGKDVKYITGSGQTTKTKDRVLIFYRESDTIPFKRPKKSKK